MSSTPKPDPLCPGRYIAPKKGTCARCRGPIVKGEWFYPTRRGTGWIGPCCTAR